MGWLARIFTTSQARRRRVRANRHLLWIVLAAGLTACASTGEEKSWEEQREEQVREFMLHLNNESLTERWREGMVEVGLKSPEDRTYVLSHCSAAFDKSMQRGGVGTGVLRSNGRRRVMEITTRLGDNPDGRQLLKAGIADNEEVRMVAAAGLADWGDESAVPVLLRTVLEVEPDDPMVQVGMQGLRRMAVPKRRAVFLNGLTQEGRTSLKPIVLKTFRGTVSSGSRRCVRSPAARGTPTPGPSPSRSWSRRETTKPPSSWLGRRCRRRTRR